MNCGFRVISGYPPWGKFLNSRTMLMYNSLSLVLSVVNIYLLGVL